MWTEYDLKKYELMVWELSGFQIWAVGCSFALVVVRTELGSPIMFEDCWSPRFCETVLELS